MLSPFSIAVNSSGESDWLQWLQSLNTNWKIMMSNVWIAIVLTTGTHNSYCIMQQISRNIFNEFTRLPTLDPFEWYHFHDPWSIVPYIHMSVQCSCFNGIILPTFYAQNDTNEIQTLAPVSNLLFGILQRHHISMLFKW